MDIRGGVKKKFPLLAILSLFDVRLNAKYISALLAAVSRGQERSLKTFGSNSLRARPGEISRGRQTAASRLVGTVKGTGLPSPPTPSSRVRRPGVPAATQRSEPASGPGSGRSPLPGSGEGFRGEGLTPPIPPATGFRADAAQCHASPFHQHPDLYFFSLGRVEPKNNLQGVFCCCCYLSL